MKHWLWSPFNNGLIRLKFGIHHKTYLDNFNDKVRVIHKVSEVRTLGFLCYNIIAFGQKILKVSIKSFLTKGMVILIMAYSTR